MAKYIFSLMSLIILFSNHHWFLSPAHATPGVRSVHSLVVPFQVVKPLRRSNLRDLEFKRLVRAQKIPISFGGREHAGNYIVRWVFSDFSSFSWLVHERETVREDQYARMYTALEEIHRQFMLEEGWSHVIDARSQLTSLYVNFIKSSLAGLGLMQLSANLTNDDEEMKKWLASILRYLIPARLAVPVVFSASVPTDNLSHWDITRQRLLSCSQGQWSTFMVQNVSANTMGGIGGVLYSYSDDCGNVSYEYQCEFLRGHHRSGDTVFSGASGVPGYDFSEPINRDRDTDDDGIADVRDRSIDANRDQIDDANQDLDEDGVSDFEERASGSRSEDTTSVPGRTPFAHSQAQWILLFSRVGEYTSLNWVAWQNSFLENRVSDLVARSTASRALSLTGREVMAGMWQLNFEPMPLMQRMRTLRWQ